MKSTAYFVLLPCICGCGASATPAPSTTPSQATSAPVRDAHREHESTTALVPSAAAESPLAISGESPVASKAPAESSDAAASEGTKASAGAQANGGTLTVTITSTPTTAAKQAVVYLEDAPKVREIGGSMDNRQMAFSPHVLVVTAGAKITFTNSDPFPHNVFSPDNEKWDMGVIPSKGARVRRFEKPGFYTVLCNMHPNMKAYIVVVPSSYFAKAEKSGEFAIRDVPAGKHELVVWAPGVKTERREVVIDGDRTLSVEMHR